MKKPLQVSNGISFQGEIVSSAFRLSHICQRVRAS